MREGWGAEEPCPWVSCRYHNLIAVQPRTEDGEGLRVHGDAAAGQLGGPRVYRPRSPAELVALVLTAMAALEGMRRASCALRVGSYGPQRAASIGAVLSLTRQGAHNAVKAAMRAAKASGVTPDGLRALAAITATSTTGVTK